MKIALVIPTYKPHFIYLERLCQNISEQTRLPDLVMIRASSCDTEEARAQLALVAAKPWPFPLQILDTAARQYQAQNRNEGVAAVPPDFDAVSFFDSDDWMHPRRLELIESAFLQGAEVVLHETMRGNSYDGTWLPYEEPPPVVWNSINLQKESATQQGNQILSLSVFKNNYGNGIPLGKQIRFLRPIPMDENLEEELSMPFGYISVLLCAAKAVQFDKEALGYEDAKFLSDLVIQRYTIAGIRAALAYYVLLGSTL